MRRLRIHTYCDQCQRAGGAEVEVDDEGALTVAVENGPPTRLDLCSAHRAELYEPVAKLFAEHGVRVAVPELVRRPQLRPSAVASWRCPVCTTPTFMQRHSAVGHLVSAHGAARVEQPGQCPDCGFESEFASGMASHRSRAHGYSQVDAMLEALDKPEPKPRARRRADG